MTRLHLYTQLIQRISSELVWVFGIFVSEKNHQVKMKKNQVLVESTELSWKIKEKTVQISGIFHNK